MELTYFDLQFRLDNKDRCLLWFTSDADNSDGVVVNESGMIPIFINRTELMSYAEAGGFAPTEFSEPHLHNLDMLAKWLKMKKMKRARHVDCVQFLNAWNLFTDVSKSIGGNFDSDKERAQKIYDKMFWGNNLPALTPTGKFYVPIWSGHEMEIMHEVLSHGLSMFRTHIKHP